MLNIIRGILHTFGILLIVDATYLMATKDMFGKIVRDIQISSLELRIYSTLLCYFCLATIIYYFIIFKNKHT